MTRSFAGVHAADGLIPTPDALLAALSDSGADIVAAVPALVLASTGRGNADRSPLVVVDGWIDNLGELSRELGADPSSKAEELLSLGYRRWGYELLRYLRGRFAIVIWDSEAADGLLATDQLGSRPLFWHTAAGRLTFASEVAPLLRLLPSRPAPDRTSVIRNLVIGFPEHGYTLYEGVRRLEGGHALVLDRDGSRRVRYWAPRYRGTLQISRDEAVRELKSKLQAAIELRTRGENSVGVLLSGGLDSSSVAALTADLKGARRVRGYSAIFPSHPAVDESARLTAVSNALGIRTTQYPVEGGSLIPESLEFLRRWELPAFGPNLLFTLELLRIGARDGIGLFLDGQGGDELFGCSRYLLADRLRHGRLLSAVDLARRLPGGGEGTWKWSLRRILYQFGVKGSVPRAVHRARRSQNPLRFTPQWLTPESARVYVETDEPWLWKSNGGPRWWAYLAETLTRWRERSGSRDLFRREAMLAGVTGAHPFHDDLDLIEFVLQLPPELAFDPDVDRPLLREAMRGLLPDEIRVRQGKNFYTTFYVDYLSRVDRAQIVELLRSPDFRLREYVQPEAVERLLLEPLLSAKGKAWVMPVWRLFTTECWLRQQEERRDYVINGQSRPRDHRQSLMV